MHILYAKVCLPIISKKLTKTLILVLGINYYLSINWCVNLNLYQSIGWVSSKMCIVGDAANLLLPNHSITFIDLELYVYCIYLVAKPIERAHVWGQFVACKTVLAVKCASSPPPLGFCFRYSWKIFVIQEFNSSAILIRFIVGYNILNMLFEKTCVPYSDCRNAPKKNRPLNHSSLLYRFL